jgi:hypothetical protein
VSIFHRQRPGTRRGQVQRKGMNEKLYDRKIQKQRKIRSGMEKGLRYKWTGKEEIEYI